MKYNLNERYDEHLRNFIYNVVKCVYKGQEPWANRDLKISQRVECMEKDHKKCFLRIKKWISYLKVN